MENTCVNSKRERARAVIRALLAKTEARGCTAEEAEKAAAKAAELMLAHDLTIEDAQEVRDDVYEAMRKKYGAGIGRVVRHHEAADLWGAVAQLCEVRCYFDRHDIVFFGTKQDCEVAHYLLDLFITCSEADWQQVRIDRDSDIDTSIRGRKGFMRGFVLRMRERLYALKKERECARQAATPTGRELLVLKQQIVDERYCKVAKDLGLVTRHRYRSGAMAGTNYDAGRASANRTNITTGVGSDHTAKIRGGRSQAEGNA